ncbi:MAG: SMC-Scp complex subunit ScpB [Gammaproteobacteria bacterium]|nr:SMC-Scp complex subunit ScpB [Gammaproteobacteria bacterium]
MNTEKIKNIIEAALMVSDKPLSMQRLLSLFEQDSETVDREVIRGVIDSLQQEYTDRGIELKEIASGFRIQVKREYADWVNRLFDEKPPRYSRALLETLAIIAYRQPLTRAEIEDIRGVSVSTNIVKTLQEREWIKVVGHKDVPGKPELLATTKEFLDYFNLKKLSELPSLAEIKELNRVNPDLFDELENRDTAEIMAVTENNNNDAETEEPLAEEEELFPVADDDNKVIPFTG